MLSEGVCVHVCVCVHVRMRVRVFVCVCVFVYVYMYMCFTCACVYVTHTHTHTHTDTTARPTFGQQSASMSTPTNGQHILKSPLHSESKYFLYRLSIEKTLAEP